MNSPLQERKADLRWLGMFGSGLSNKR